MFFLLFGLLSTVGFKGYGILERHENILCGDTVMKLFSINNRRKTFLELRRYHQESERERQREARDNGTSVNSYYVIIY
jgi:hypothetical protein